MANCTSLVWWLPLYSGVNKMTIYRPYDQQYTLVYMKTVFRTVADRPSPPTVGHLVELKQDPGQSVILTPRLLPYLNICLSQETSNYYHRQYCISPYNILLAFHRAQVIYQSQQLWLICSVFSQNYIHRSQGGAYSARSIKPEKFQERAQSLSCFVHDLERSLLLPLSLARIIELVF